MKLQKLAAILIVGAPVCGAANATGLTFSAENYAVNIQTQLSAGKTGTITGEIVLSDNSGVPSLISAELIVQNLDPTFNDTYYYNISGETNSTLATDFTHASGTIKLTDNTTGAGKNTYVQLDFLVASVTPDALSGFGGTVSVDPANYNYVSGTIVPEPTTIALFGTALAGLGLLLRQRLKAARVAG